MPLKYTKTVCLLKKKKKKWGELWQTCAKHLCPELKKIARLHPAAIAIDNFIVLSDIAFI